LKNVLFSLFAIFEKRKSNLQKLIFSLHNLLINNVSKKCRFIKINWQIIRIKCHFIPIIWQFISAISPPPKILPLKNVLFSLSPFFVFHFNLLSNQIISLSKLLLISLRLMILLVTLTIRTNTLIVLTNTLTVLLITLTIKITSLLIKITSRVIRPTLDVIYLTAFIIFVCLSFD
jgi:hypothetical protein